MKLIEAIGEPALLELVAEECAELAHAALKLARVVRRENPTPCSMESCREKVEEECADVRIVLEKLIDLPWFDPEMFQKFFDEKTDRMYARIADSKNNV